MEGHGQAAVAIAVMALVLVVILILFMGGVFVPADDGGIRIRIGT